MTSSGKAETEQLFNKIYNFHELNKNHYRPLLKNISVEEQARAHPFLTRLRATEDRFTSILHIPKHYRLLELLSNIRGSFSTSQDLLDPFPYLEFGDLPQRLLYNEPQLLAYEELELMHLSSPSDGPGPMESLEFGRVLLGIDASQGMMDREALRTANKERDGANTSTVGDKESWIDTITDTLRGAVLGESKTDTSKGTGSKGSKSSRPSNRGRSRSSHRPKDFLPYQERPSSSMHKSHKPPRPQSSLADPSELPPTISFINSKTIKYYDRSILHVEKKNFQQQVETENKEGGERKLTSHDFENAYDYSREMKLKIPNRVERDSQRIKNYATVIDNLCDIVLSVIEVEGEKLTMSLATKVDFLSRYAHSFQGLYIGNHYCPEIIKYLLEEYLFIKGMRQGNLENGIGEIQQTGRGNKLRSRYDKSNSFILSDGMKDQNRPQMFTRTLDMLKDHCEKLNIPDKD